MGEPAFSKNSGRRRRSTFLRRPRMAPACCTSRFDNEPNHQGRYSIRHKNPESSSLRPIHAGNLQPLKLPDLSKASRSTTGASPLISVSTSPIAQAPPSSDRVPSPSSGVLEGARLIPIPSHAPVAGPDLRASSGYFPCLRDPCGCRPGHFRFRLFMPSAAGPNSTSRGGWIVPDVRP